MRATRSWLLGTCLLLATSATSSAQLRAPAQRTEQAIEDLLPLANDPDDPIGLDAEQRSLGAEPRPAPSTLAAHAGDRQRFGPEPPPMAARSGEVLTAMPAVRESAHRVSLALMHGLGLVQVEIVLDNSAEKPAEVLYRLAVPDDAALGSLEVCRDESCRSGLPDAANSGKLSIYDDALQARGPLPAGSAPPIAHARKLRDARGTALVLRAAPVMQGKPLVLRVSYVVSAPMHGGVVRMRLPARGMDPRAAALELTLRAPGLQDPRIAELPASAEATRIDPWSAVEISARMPGNARQEQQLMRFDCGSRACMHAYVAAAPAAHAPVDMVLAIDASPSMEGPARSRLLTTLAAILASAPRGSQVRALMFASQALPLIADARDPGTLALSAFTQASFDAELGSATRFEAAWATIAKWSWGKAGLRKLVVVVGDGGLTTGPARPFEQARRAGVEVSVVNIADRSSGVALARGAALTRGTLIEAGRSADDATRGLGGAALEERVSALFARNAIARLAANSGGRGGRSELPALRAGESLSVDAKLQGASRPGLTLDGRTLRVERPRAELAAALGVRAAALHGLHEPRAALAAVDLRDHKRILAERPAGQDQPSKRGVLCDRRGPAFQRSGLSLEPTPVSLAHERARCAFPPEKPKPAQSNPEIGVGMPGSPLLSMLRLRIVPVARACFRRDRAGRADYQVRATFVFALAEREVVSAAVEGPIADELRLCLLDAVDTLAVPRFSGLVIVRYPLVTEREALPSQIELTAHTAEALDAVIVDPSQPDREVGQNKSLSLDGPDPHLHTPPSRTR